MTCGIGIAIGLGELGLALLCSILAVVVLGVLGRMEAVAEDGNAEQKGTN
jgi:uncharacterized membrane protein YhiD involved in acid resistance